MRTPIFPLQWYTHLRPQVEEEPKTLPLPLLLPILPAELWRKIIGHTVRIAGADSFDLEDPFSTPYEDEEFPTIGPMIFEDRKNLSLVCSSWHSVVLEISAEYLDIRSNKQLKKLVKKLQSCSVRNGRRLGERTKRIDFNISGYYTVSNVVRLLQMTPNLSIYKNHNSLPRDPKILRSLQRYTPVDVMGVLAESCGQSLRRIEWTGQEYPRYQDLAKLCNRLPNLMTLRLVAMHSYPSHQDEIPPMLLLPQLKTLSLGIIPANHQGLGPPGSLPWDPFIQHLSATPTQIPSLERFECDNFPIQKMSFFSMHGHKITLFRTNSRFPRDQVSVALDLCPNLHSLVLAQGVGIIPLPTFHPTLKRICIFPSQEDVVVVPRRIYDVAVVTPLNTLLESLEGMVAPHLVELRIRNTGAYTDLISYTALLRFWWIRWNIRGVELCDKAGTPYIHVQDRSILDSVRA